jgi:hypothetical protein
MGRVRITIGRKALAARIMSVLLGALLLLASPIHAYHAASAAKGSAELALYTLPDGSVPVLCLGDSGAGHGQGDGRDACPFCRVSAAVPLPLPAGDYEACRFATPLQFHPSAGQPVRQPVLLALAPPTGPPSLLI